MLIEWLWKYEYFLNLRKMTHSTRYYLIYGNIMLFLSTILTNCFYHLRPPIRRFLIYLIPLNYRPPSGNNDAPKIIYPTRSEDVKKVSQMGLQTKHYGLDNYQLVM